MRSKVKKHVMLFFEPEKTLRIISVLQEINQPQLSGHAVISRPFILKVVTAEIYHQYLLFPDGYIQECSSWYKLTFSAGGTDQNKGQNIRNALYFGQLLSLGNSRQESASSALQKLSSVLTHGLC